MLFNSPEFLIFFTVLCALYFVLPRTMRPLLLLVASGYFYMAYVPYFIFVLLFLIAVDYACTNAIEPSEGRLRLFWLLAGLASNLSVLFFFKYFNFFNQNIEALANFVGWNYSVVALTVLLPLGLSFHVFQSISYLVEVYKKRYPAERNLLIVALYIMFFPQLVAGPIERPAQLMPQLKNPRPFDGARITEGLQRMLLGFFKKVAVGDGLGVMVNFIFARADSADSSVLLIGVIAFALQLYADFSGYSDIAVGGAKVLGIDLEENFRRPFFARSIAEFWRRWHISLSFWFRDYVYFPIVWRLRNWGRISEYTAVLITFALVGIWHGAGWTYLSMGIAFGLYICIGLITKRRRGELAAALHIPSIPRAVLQTSVTFALAVLAFIFFRSSSLPQAWTILDGLVTRWSTGAFSFLYCNDYCSFYLLGISRKELAVLVLAILALFIYEFLQEFAIRPRLFQKRPVRWTIYYATLAWILCFGSLAPTTFIYFQF